MNKYRADNGLSQVGFLNPTLYDTGENSTSYFNDITDGKNNCMVYSGPNPEDNAVCCESGFTCTSGWDPVTGWGSMDFTEFSAVFDVSTPYTIDDDNNKNNDDDDGGLSEGEIAAVVICTVFGVVVCMAVGYRCFNPPSPAPQQQSLMANPVIQANASYPWVEFVQPMGNPPAPPPPAGRM